MSSRYVAAVLPPGLLLSGCSSPQPPVLPQSRLFIVAVDKSASRLPGTEMDEQRFLKQLASQLSFGDEFVLMQIQADGLHDQPQKWITTVPKVNGSGYPTVEETEHLSAVRATAGNAIDEFFHTKAQEPIEHTDIMTSLHLASQRAREADGRPVTLLLLSDMEQSDGAIEMGRAARMPAPDWVAKQQSQGLVPSFKNACVVAIGADSTNAAGVQVKRFWQSYFHAAGTELQDQNYLVLSPQPKRDLCS